MAGAGNEVLTPNINIKSRGGQRKQLPPQPRISHRSHSHNRIQLISPLNCKGRRGGGAKYITYVCSICLFELGWNVHPNEELRSSDL